MTQTSQTAAVKPGDTIEGFNVTAVNHLPQLHNVMYRLEHIKTGAQLIHLDNDDDNNCFAIGFRTTPTDSTGVAHVLEHTVLCGSQRFPVRDPFFAMIKRSMKTFMNALTSSDWTLYPFATQNETDYFNLLAVYLDAVFFPLLKETSFQQEGHRLEFKEENNPDAELIPQGIVYSEMMGAMSSQSHVMHRSLGDALFPTTTYRFNSGGDPEAILELTYQQLVAFHRRYYHPSNAFIYTYGRIPLPKRLKAINDNLSPFERIIPDTAVPDERRYTTPRVSTYHYPLNRADDDGEKVQMALAWLTCRITEPLEVLSIQVINQILLGHAGAPLRKRLLESRLGKSLADTTGFEDDIKEPYFSVGLQGMAAENIETAEALILETLEEVVRTGIQPEQIESAIHQMEMDTKEISGGHYPYSLNLLFRFFGTWMHGGDPVRAIDFDQTLNQLHQKIRQGGFLEQQIRHYLLDNPHRVSIRLYPDHELEQKQADAISRTLRQRQSTLSAEDKQRLIAAVAALKADQEKEEDLSCLPTLSVEDIPKDIGYLASFAKTRETIDVTFYDQPTNGILYVGWHFDIEKLSSKDRVWLPLLGYLLPKVGAGGLGYEAMASAINRYTGGFSAAPAVEVNLQDPEEFKEYFVFSSKALTRNIDRMFELGLSILNHWDFNDHAKVQSLIAQRTNHMINGLVQHGHSYASSLAARDFSPTSRIDEIYGGVHQVQFMKPLLPRCQDDLPRMLEQMNTILKRLLNRSQLTMVVIGEKTHFTLVREHLTRFVNKLDDRPFSNTTAETDDAPASGSIQYHREAWVTTTPVSYVAQCFKTPSFTHPDSPILLVLSELLRSGYLHGEIREKGGAYGGMASYNADVGILTLLSYRDPHLARTLNVYNQALAWLQNGRFDRQAVEEAVLQTCSQMDTPLSPAGKAMIEYMHERKGKTKAMRQQFREGVLGCTREDLIRVGSTYLAATPSVAAVTSEAIVDHNQSMMETPLTVFPI